jgi:hypothetical protein
MDSDGSVGGVVGVEIANPTSFEVDYTLSPDSQDAWWSFAPDHAHGTLAPGETRTVSFRIDRLAAPLDRTFRAVEFVLDRELLTKSFRYTVPTTRHEVSMDLAQLRPARPAAESVLRVRDGGVAMVHSGLVEIPDGPMTVECWFNADRFGERVGLIAKTESSDYGIFVSNGRPEFSVHLGGGYATAEASGQVLRPGNWHHIAGVFDGREVRLYVDGLLVARAPGEGERRTNTLPLVIGADVDGSGNPTSPFDGAIDEVRLSSAAKYSGDSFTPARRLHADADTVMWLPMDGMIGPWLYDHAGRGAHGRLRGGAALETP